MNPAERQQRMLEEQARRFKQRRGPHTPLVASKTMSNRPNTSSNTTPQKVPAHNPYGSSDYSGSATGSVQPTPIHATDSTSTLEDSEPVSPILDTVPTDAFAEATSVFNAHSTSSSSSSQLSSRQPTTSNIQEFLQSRNNNNNKSSADVVEPSQVEKELAAQGVSSSYEPATIKKQVILPSVHMSREMMRQFVHQPAPRGTTIQMQIVRDRSGLKRFYPQYQLFFKDLQQFCLSARKRKRKRTTNYLISLDQEDSHRSNTDSYVAKLRSNFFGTQFTVYDHGERAEKVDLKNPNHAPIRKELAMVLYESNVLGAKGPRKMHVVTPAMDEDSTPLVIQPLQDSESIGNRIEAQDMNDLVVMHNKSPQWNEESQSYVLNFKGRVTVASVKNFQLIHPDNPEYIVLQFGKRGDDDFSMDFQYPLSAVQAFGICLSSMDNKLACE